MLWHYSIQSVYKYVEPVWQLPLLFSRCSQLVLCASYYIGTQVSFHFQLLSSLPAGARVGLEQTFYRETEGFDVIELCAIVFYPNIKCPIKFPFNVQLLTADGTAGKL